MSIVEYNSLKDFLRAIDIEADQEAEMVIHRIEKVTPPAPYQSPVFRANYFTFVLLKAGHSTYTLDQQTYPARARTLYFTNPGHLKAFHAIESIEGVLISFSEGFLKSHISPDIFQGFPFLLAETVPPQDLSPELFGELWECSEKILLEQESTASSRLDIMASYFRIFLLKVREELYRNYNPLQEGDRNSEIVRQFKIRLEQHFRQLAAADHPQLPQVSDFAGQLQLHPNYFATVIKSKTGKTVQDWIIAKVIDEAKTLLLHSTEPIKTIAYRLGFSAPNYFNKYFKKQVGLTPGQFRKSS